VKCDWNFNGILVENRCQNRQLFILHLHINAPLQIIPSDITAMFVVKNRMMCLTDSDKF